MHTMNRSILLSILLLAVAACGSQGDAVVAPVTDKTEPTSQAEQAFTFGSWTVFSPSIVPQISWVAVGPSELLYGIDVVNSTIGRNHRLLKQPSAGAALTHLHNGYGVAIDAGPAGIGAVTAEFGDIYYDTPSAWVRFPSGYARPFAGSIAVWNQFHVIGTDSRIYTWNGSAWTDPKPLLPDYIASMGEHVPQAPVTLAVGNNEDLYVVSDLFVPFVFSQALGQWGELANPQFFITRQISGSGANGGGGTWAIGNERVQPPAPTPAGWFDQTANRTTGPPPQFLSVWTQHPGLQTSDGRINLFQVASSRQSQFAYAVGHTGGATGTGTPSGNWQLLRAQP